MKKEGMFIEILLPDDVAELQKKGGVPSPEIINEWQDISDRRLYISDVDESIVDYLSYYITKWNLEDKRNEIAVEDRKPIKVFINSNGGSLNETMYCNDIMMVSETPVYTICQSKAYSAGGLLLIAGDKRFCYPSSTYLLHAGSTGMGGNTTTVFDTLEFQKRYEGKVKDMVLTNTKITEDLYDEVYRKEWYLTAEEMLQYGIVDKILTDII